MSASRDWDAVTYDRVSDVQLGWALEQLERLPLRGDEVVVDAGCGSGRVTAELVRRLPRGRVYGVDVSSAMTEHAREALGGRATILCQDLMKLQLPEPVDAVFSNATFHWIRDHDALFAALFAALKPGARLVAQCGGRGNIDAFRRVAETVTGEPPFAAYFADWPAPWNYAGDGETAARLDRQVRLAQDRDVAPGGPLGDPEPVAEPLRGDARRVLDGLERQQRPRGGAQVVGQGPPPSRS